ncbi:MAG: molybdopterin cofactor-binding domain-containing protein [Cyclobacteriaceae bacterium]
MKTAKIPRREFIRLSAMSGAFLAIGCTSSIGKDTLTVFTEADLGKELNQYIFIDEAGRVTIYNHRPEMGQGTFQSIPMIIAEELEVDMDAILIKQSPANRALYGDQMVVGSRSIQNNYELMRQMGAAAKEMLVEAAAQTWGVVSTQCRAEKGMVSNTKTGDQLHYGKLVARASELKVPQKPKLKDPKEFKIIGKSIPRRDVPEKTNGSAIFGMDCQVDGMLYATIQHSPVFLGKIKTIDDQKALQVPGVTHVLRTSRDVYGKTIEGVAVVANSYYAADQGRKMLAIEWDHQDLDQWNTEKIFQDYREAAKKSATVFKDDGNFEAGFSSGSKKIEAEYETPYQSHTCMEPMNCIVQVQKDKCAFWGSTQNPNGMKSFLSRKYGVPEEKVEINYTYMGGGFGRRSLTDVVEEAADLSQQTGRPIKLIWTRDDDTTQGPFRACSLNVCKGAVDQQGNLVAFEHKVICQDIRNQTGDDDTPTRGILGGVVTEYEVPNFRVSGVLRKLHIPIGYWRSVYHSTNCFAHESFMDELAVAAGKDPLDFRLTYLKGHRRYTNVLKLVAEKSNWYGERRKDTGKGVAIVERSGAFVAMVVDVARESGKVKVKKITTVVDCGTTVNPDVVKAQTEGSSVMGLTAAYKSAITFEKGAVVQKNFDTYPMLTLAECPEMEVHVVESNDPPEGAGEAGLPTVAPALCNAIYQMTGKRIRKLPFNLQDV